VMVYKILKIYGQPYLTEDEAKAIATIISKRLSQIIEKHISSCPIREDFDCDCEVCTEFDECPYIDRIIEEGNDVADKLSDALDTLIYLDWDNENTDIWIHSVLPDKKNDDDKNPTFERVLVYSVFDGFSYFEDITVRDVKESERKFDSILQDIRLESLFNFLFKSEVE